MKEKIEVSIKELPVAIRAIRNSKKLTMQEFALISGIGTKQAVYALETGRTKIGLNRFCSICKNLKISEPKILIEI